MASKAKLKSMVDASEEYLRKQHDRWDSSITLYKGEVTMLRKRPTPIWNHIVEVNLTRPVIDSMLPNLIFKTPKIMFRPGREIADREIQNQALMIENDMNAVQLELKLANEYRRATKDGLILGDGFVKYGMSDTFGYDPDTYPFPAPFIKRASPWEVGVDPQAREHDFSDHNYIWFRSLVPIYKARRDKSLKNPERLKATSISQFLPKHLQEQTTGTKKTEPYEFAALYEIWCREDGKMYVVDEDGNDYRNQPFPYALDGRFPAVHLGFIDIPDEFYCPSEAEYLEQLQLEASEKRTQWLNHTRRFNRKYQCPPEVSDDDMKILAEGGDGTCVRAREPIIPIQDAPMPGDVLTEIRMIQDEAREISGVSAYQKGSSEKGVSTATEANMINASANIRIEERRMIVSDAIAEGARLLYNIMRPSKGWPQLPFEFSVDISTMKRPDDNEKRQDLMTFGQIAQPFPEFKRADWLRDVALSFGKPPEQYTFSPEEMQQQQQNAPPSPEQQKAQGEQQKSQLEMQAMQMKMQLEMEQMKQELLIKQQEGQMEIQLAQAKLQIEMQKLGLEREKMQMKRIEGEQDMALKEKQASLDSAMMEHDHEMNMSQMKEKSMMQSKVASEQTKAKVSQAKQLAKAKPKTGVK